MGLLFLLLFYPFFFPFFSSPVRGGPITAPALFLSCNPLFLPLFFFSLFPVDCDFKIQTEACRRFGASSALRGLSPPFSFFFFSSPTAGRNRHERDNFDA